eukprot:COSAG02_NODE_6166_length_3754_cov_34.198906_5_plen_68_part_00
MTAVEAGAVSVEAVAPLASVAAAVVLLAYLLRRYDHEKARSSEHCQTSSKTHAKKTLVGGVLGAAAS